MTLVAIPVPLVPCFIDRVMDLLSPAIRLSNGECTLDSVRRRLIQGECFLVLLVAEGGRLDMAITCETIVFESGKKVMSLPLMGGRGIDGLSEEFMPFMQGLAKSAGCVEIYGYAARRGWLRKLSGYGWSEFRYLITSKVES